MAVQWIRLVTVFVSDQERALRFYRDLLGFAVRADVVTEQGRWLEVVPPRGETAITLVPVGPGTRQMLNRPTHIVLATDDIAATHQEFVHSGIRFVELPRQQPWGGWQAQFTDPDGNLFVLVQPAGVMPGH